jgi:hypothetical protein
VGSSRRGARRPERRVPHRDRQARQTSATPALAERGSSAVCPARATSSVVRSDDSRIRLASGRCTAFRTSTAMRGPKRAWNCRYPQGCASHRSITDPSICRDVRRRQHLSGVPENRGVPSSSLGLAIG